MEIIEKSKRHLALALGALDWEMLMPGLKQLPDKDFDHSITMLLEIFQNHMKREFEEEQKDSFRENWMCRVGRKGLEDINDN